NPGNLCCIICSTAEEMARREPAALISNVANPTFILRYFILLLREKTATKIVNPAGGGADVTISHQIFDQRILRVGKIQRADRHFAQALRRLSRVQVRSLEQ